MPNPVRGMYFALLKKGKSKEEAAEMVRKRFKLAPKRKTKTAKRKRKGGKTLSSEIAGLHFQGREQYRSIPVRPSDARSGGKIPRKYMKQAKKIYSTKLKGWPKKMGGKKR